MMEAAGNPASPKDTKKGARPKAGDTPAGYRVAEIYFERRGSRSIVGNIYKGKVDNVLPGLEAAFVDIGLEKNGFLHVDEIVLPGVEKVKRGRGQSSGTRISDLLSPGPGDRRAGHQGPAQDQGRAALDGDHDRRPLHGLRPDGRGRRRLAPARGQGARAPAQGGQAARPRRRRRDHPHRGPGRQARGLRARAAVPVQAQRGAPEARRGDDRARHGLPGGRPLDPRRARHLLRALREGDRRRPQAAPAADLVLRAHRARARRPRRAVGGRRRPVRGLRGRQDDRGDARAPRRPAQRRLPGDRLRRGADGHRRQLRAPSPAAASRPGSRT